MLSATSQVIYRAFFTDRFPDWLLASGIILGAMKWRRWLRLLRLGILALSFVSVGWGFLPVQSTEHRIEIQPSQMKIEEGPEFVGEAAVLENRQIVLDWSPMMRAGDEQLIELSFLKNDNLPDSQTTQLQPTAMTANGEKIEDIYLTYAVIAEAHLDVRGFTIEPGQTISQPLLPEHTIRYAWRVRAVTTGQYQGTAWLKLRFLPKGGGAEEQLALSAQTFSIRTTNLAGLGGPAVRGMGVAGIILGLVMWIASARRNQRRDFSYN